MKAIVHNTYGSADVKAAGPVEHPGFDAHLDLCDALIASC
jgi:hypothetical protein